MIKYHSNFAFSALTLSTGHREGSPSAHNMTLPASAAEHGRLQQISIDSWYARRRRPEISIHISCPQSAQFSRTSLLLSIDGTDRQTDRRTDTRPLHTPCLSRTSLHFIYPPQFKIQMQCVQYALLHCCCILLQVAPSGESYGSNRRPGRK